MVFSFVDFDQPLRHLDVFLKRELSFEEMRADAAEVAVHGRTLKIMSAARLLAIKRSIQPLRDKDIFDIKALEKLTKRDEDKEN